MSKLPEVFIWLGEMVASCIMGSAIGFTYWHLNRGFAYSYTFVHACILTVVICAVIARIVVSASEVSGGNAALAFALVGMLGLIRFRTVVKDTREFTYLFLAIATGLAIGSRSIAFGVAGCSIALFLLFSLGKYNVGMTDSAAFRVKIKSKSDQNERINNIISALSRDSELVYVKKNADGACSYCFDLVSDTRQGAEEKIFRSFAGDLFEDISVTRLRRSRPTASERDDD